MAEPEAQDQEVAKAEQIEFNPAKFKDHVEVIGKTVLGIVAFCYATGILVESLYLGSFGVYHISLFRFTYVFAGLWAILIMLVTILIPAFPIFQYIFNFSLKKASSSMFLLFLIMVFLMEIGISFSSLMLQLLVGTAVVGMSSLPLLHITSHDDNDTDWVYRLAFVLLPIGFAILSLALFSTNIFPQISVRYGGGKPLTVQLLLEVSKKNAWMIQKNFDLCENDKAKLAAPEEVQLIATKPMPLLLATDTDYIIRKDENTAVSITRDEVKTVLYLNNVDPNIDVCADPNPPVQAQ